MPVARRNTTPSVPARRVLLPNKLCYEVPSPRRPATAQEGSGRERW